MHMEISSPAFVHEQRIPAKYTCQGANINPKLVIKGMPTKTKSLVLIVDDPDAPRKIWVHWVVYNIPPQEVIEENSVPGMQGINDFKMQNYGGPCPPFGVHRYFFKLYALDSLLALSEGAFKEKVLDAMKGHVLAEATLVGLYEKK